MMSTQSLTDNPLIMDRNLELFAKMIKFETIIRNIYVRIETD